MRRLLLTLFCKTAFRSNTAEQFYTTAHHWRSSGRSLNAFTEKIDREIIFVSYDMISRYAACCDLTFHIVIGTFICLCCFVSLIWFFILYITGQKFGIIKKKKKCFWKKHDKYDLTLCQSRLHTASETFVRQKKIGSGSMHFDRKGWGIRKNACKNYGLSVQWPLVSRDPSEIILIYWFGAQEIFLIIINVENSCAD